MPVMEAAALPLLSCTLEKDLAKAARIVAKSESGREKRRHKFLTHQKLFGGFEEHVFWYCLLCGECPSDVSIVPSCLVV